MRVLAMPATGNVYQFDEPPRKKRGRVWHSREPQGLKPVCGACLRRG